MKSVILKKTDIKHVRFVPWCVCIGLVYTLSACDKDHEKGYLVDSIKASETESFEENVGQLIWKAEGGKDTLYVASNSALTVSFETNEINSWVEVDKIEAIPGTNKSRVILNVEPMEKSYKKRVGVLNLNNGEAFSGVFIRLNQGYNTRIEENFSWLKYGTGSPLDLTKATAMTQWTAAQKQVGWISSNTASALGMNGYMLLGTADKGGNLSSSIFPGLEKDSLLLLTFDAVAYVSKTGLKDDNKLTVKLVGAEFEDGQTSKVLTLNYYDYQSALLLNSMWEGGRFEFRVKKPSLNPTASTIQLQFMTGDQQEKAANRLFIDNINLYITEQFTPVKK
ncbi:hypothetical protein [Sphingobacterium faecale]|uniref:Uncharacterized protein n=1 Tax=Sphingobacterium faecale TaxID=2803775 RepID=A0ABS1R9Y3_9SPHI|nr:hypothetical protein [Sphingobacterium faecale]MBL1411024.1 hypothetical protein [Sphingobacterium faecale]